MFALFFSLYHAMLLGGWYNMNMYHIANFLKSAIDKIGAALTSLFNNVDAPVTDLGTTLLSPIQVTYTGGTFYSQPILGIVALVLALITSISIVVMSVKGVKKAFGIFFGHIR